MERHSAQKLHSSATALLQIFDLFFAGSRVATRFCDVTYGTVFIENFLFIRNYVATLSLSMVEQQKQESFARPLNTSLDCRGVAHQQIGKASTIVCMRTACKTNPPTSKL